MRTETPETIVNPKVETEEPENLPGDQAGASHDTGAAPTLSSITGMHTESHPGFDPSLHATAPDGSPKRKADGSYALKRGRKAGAPLPPKGGVSGSNSEKQSDTATSDPARISSEEAARQSANLLINGCVLLCGEEIGVPEDKNEAQGLLFSFKNYYDSRGVPNIPPEIGLLIACGMYVVPRVRKSETAKGKLTRFIEMVKSKVMK